MNAGPLLYDEVMELDLGIVYSCPPEEAVPHILAYFQQEFSNPFPAPKPVSHEEELLLEQIDSAFDGVHSGRRHRPDDDGTHRHVRPQGNL